MTNKDLKMSGNKGEWSELYVFMKLLSQGRVYAANEKVEKIEDVYYPILKIMREETRGEIIDYIIGDNQINVEMHSNRILSIDRKEMGNQADRLLSEIATHSGSFELEDVANFAWLPRRAVFPASGAEFRFGREVSVLLRGKKTGGGIPL